MMNGLCFPLKKDASRKTIYIDMDALFASVEKRDYPGSIGHPLVIARHPSDTRGKGVVTTANYITRQYDIHSTMSAQKVHELCPSAIFKPGNYRKYSEISQEIREIFRRYTDVIGPVSINEVYLDVTENKVNSKSAIKIAKMIQYNIWYELQLTCSTGANYNKFLAKLASDFQKPKGLTVVLPEEAGDFLKVSLIKDFRGIGKKTAPKMYELGIFTGTGLYRQGETTLIRLFSKIGYSLYRKVHGIHDAPVQVTGDRKSIGKEHTYGTPLTTEEQVTARLRQLATEVERTLQRVQKRDKVIALKARYTGYVTVTRRVTLPEYISEKEELFYQANLTWGGILGLEQGVRLLGVTLANLGPLAYENIVLPLWEKS